MSINDMLDADIIPVLLFIIVIAVLAIPLGIVMGKKSNNDIYGDAKNNDNVSEKFVSVVSRRTMPHPASQTVTVNMVVFEMNDGERIELAIKDTTIYGTMIEGDKGILRYQGKKFIEFKREIKKHEE